MDSNSDKMERIMIELHTPEAVEARLRKLSEALKEVVLSKHYIKTIDPELKFVPDDMKHLFK